MDEMNDPTAWLNSLTCTCGRTGAEHCKGCDACPGMAHDEDCMNAAPEGA